MKSNEAKEYVGYWLKVRQERPDMLTDTSNIDIVIEQLKVARRVLEDPSQIREVNQLIDELHGHK